jgi:hypothetical protein
MNNAPNAEREPYRDPGSLTALLRKAVCGRLMRRALFVLACLATLLGVFYAVENWRGKRAWEKCRGELEAQGEVIDWNRLIPAPVPDDQNIFKAPKMTEWFVRDSWPEALSGGRSVATNSPQPFSLGPLPDAKDISVMVAEVTVIRSDAPLPSEKPDAVLTFDTPAVREEAAKTLKASLGPSLEGPASCLLLARPVGQIHPAHLVVQADTVPATHLLAGFLLGDKNFFQLVPHGSNRFSVRLKGRFYTAVDYLAASRAADADFNVLREGLKRPYARMSSDYRRPFEHPVPNFVRLRTVAQMLGQQAQCYLLLGQPDAAWRELELARDVCRMLESKPASGCPTIVEAMINVAITGLYTGVIADGLRLHAWREPELVAIQHQVEQINLTPLLRAGFVAERAAVCRTFETYSRSELKKLFAFGPKAPGFWESLKNPLSLFVSFAPRGWFYQNMCADAIRGGLIRGILDPANNHMLPRKAEDIQAEVKAAIGSFPPYSFLAREAIPNFLKATQTLARNQTLVNEAYLACGLERYRLAHGEYPDTLQALVPQFAASLPHDIIGGQPLKYHRTADGHFALYSVGWNEKDDGGVAGKTNTDGDWVWQ